MPLNTNHQIGSSTFNFYNLKETGAEILPRQILCPIIAVILKVWNITY